MLFLERVKELISRENEKIIFGYGKISAGDVRNIVPAWAKIEATLRTLSRTKSEAFFAKLTEILNGIENETRVGYKIIPGSLYTEVEVDKDLFQKYKKAFTGKYEFVDCGYKMTGEDFGFISKLCPSFMFWLGTRTGEQYGLHNPKFFPDDSIIELGIDIYKVILNED